MIMKRYIILSVVIISVLLGSLFYVSITSAGKPIPQPDQVEVINFPLDEEGNIRVSAPKDQEIITVCQNYTVTGTEPGWHTYMYTFADVDVHKYRYVSAFVAYYISGETNVRLYCEPSCSNITLFSSVSGYRLDFTSLYQWSTKVQGGLSIYAPKLVFHLQIYYEESIELTIVLYCYN